MTYSGRLVATNPSPSKSSRQTTLIFPQRVLGIHLFHQLQIVAFVFIAGMSENQELLAKIGQLAGKRAAILCPHCFASC